MNSANTAMKRNKPSRPLKYLLTNNLVVGTVLDYGCGRGDDVDHLKHQFEVHGYDPNFQTAKPKKSDTVLCTFVLNVLEKKDRQEVIEKVRRLAKKRAIFAVRSHRDGITGTPYKDGFMTRKGTFQKPFSQADLQELLPDASIVHRGPFILAILESP
jgi:DNA phosphorothioation-associated putative methyltransferase